MARGGGRNPLFLIFLILTYPLAAPAAPQTAPAARPEPASEFSQEPFVFEQFHVRARFESDGTGEREIRIRVRVQSEAGVQQLGQLQFGYNAANERLEIEYVRVHKANGFLVTAGADAVQDLTAPVAREAPVYTDYRQKHVTVPGLRPGEWLEYKVVTRVHTPLAPGHFWLEHDFIHNAIVLDEQLEVDVPRSSTAKLKTAAGAEPAVREEGPRRIYAWKRANREREPDGTGESRKARRPRPPAVQLTTFSNWEEVGRWYAALERERLAADDAIRAKAAELVRGHAQDTEKLRALYDFVARNFRYVSLSFGAGRYQPHAAAEVLANQYGDCKDKHTLLASLARAAGLEVYPVLISLSRKIDPDVPSPSQFDHVISAARVAGETFWLDTTTEVAPFRLLAASLRDKQALGIPPAAPARLVTTPADPPFPSTQRVEIEGQVNELGKLSARVRYTLRGDAELLLRSAFRRTPQNQWKQLAQVVAYADGLRGEVTEVNVSDPAATEEPFRLAYQMGQAGFLDWSSKKAQLRLPLPAAGLPDAEADDEEGREPLELGTPLEVQMRLALTLPERYQARAPVPVAVKRDYAEYRSSYKLSGHTLEAERALRFVARALPAARTRDYLAFARAIRADESQILSLESTVAGTPTIPETASADDLLQAAATAFRGDNHRLAVDLLKRLLTLEPKHKTAWMLLGTAHLAAQEFASAVAAFEKQAEVNPYDENAHNLIGVTRWRQQAYEQAAAAFRKQMEVNPLHPQAQSNLAQMLVEWRKYDEAVPELEKAIALSPDEPALRVALGRAHLSLGQTEKALAAFDKAVELAPEPTVWNNVAYYLSLSHAHLDRAQQYAESAVASVAADLRNLHLDRLTPRELQRVSSLAAYWDTLGWVHFQRGNLEKAERYVLAAWRLDRHAEVGDHLGQIYEKLGRPEEALRSYAAALRASRPVPETRLRLDHLNAGKQTSEALAQLGERELSGIRDVSLAAPGGAPPDGEAEFYLVLSPGLPGPRGFLGRVDEVKFLRGREALRPLGEALRALTFPASFPDDTPTRLLRRGTLTCTAAAASCTFSLKSADSLTSVD